MEPKPQIRIIDNKKVLITNDEFDFYEKICEGYNRPNFKGKDLFQDHFEVNDDGIIIFVRPPHKQYSSMEVFTFLVSIMVNQQLRISRDQLLTFISEASTAYQNKLDELSKLQAEVIDLKNSLVKKED